MENTITVFRTLNLLEGINRNCIIALHARLGFIAGDGQRQIKNLSRQGSTMSSEHVLSKPDTPRQCSTNCHHGVGIIFSLK